MLLQRGWGRLFLEVIPTPTYKPTGLHQCEAFGFQILHISFPPQLADTGLCLSFCVTASYVALSATGVTKKCVAARSVRNAGNFLILFSSFQPLAKAHASNSLCHATISSPSNLDGRMLEAIFVHFRLFLIILPLPPVVT